VRVPARFDQDVERGWAILEDVGERTLAQRGDLSAEEVERWIEEAFEIGVRIASLPAPEVAALGSAPLDRALLEQELARTIEVVLAPRGLAPRGLESALGELCDRLASDRLVPCHRDFMARNLVPLQRGELAVLDFQDLRLGPPAYDTASLLNDTYFAPAAFEARLVARLAGLGIPAEAYRRAVAQRTLKAAGTFVSFALRGDARHLELVPRCLDRAVSCLLELPETAAVVAPLAENLRGLEPGTLC
jgi:aminoglycoside/choline kinase family phosphotransferase